jgi:hypothetical protein
MKGRESIFIIVFVDHPCNLRCMFAYLECEGEESNFKTDQSNESLLFSRLAFC